MTVARRGFLATGAAFALLPRAFADAVPPVMTLSGKGEQGGLMVGTVTVKGAEVTVDGKKVSVSPEGLFAFGIAYDRTDDIACAATLPDGRSESLKLTPVVRQYEEQAISGLPQKYVEPPPEVAARIARERAQVWALRKRDTEGTGFSEPFDWPFAGIVSGVYGSRRILNGKPMSPHMGVDIAAPEGTPIHAPASGIVSLAEDFFYEGGLTFIDHGHGVQSCYLHQSERKVKVGDVVARGDVIGLVGATGRATGPHTHWGLSWFQLKLDPSRVTRTPVPPPV